MSNVCSRDCSEQAVIPLTRVTHGRRARVAGVEGEHHARERLAHMGMLRGADVQMVRSIGRGPVLVQLLGGRLALGYKLASRIMVTQLDGGGR